MPETNLKKILISAGPIPAKLEPGMFIIGKDQNTQAMQTIAYLAGQSDFQVDVLMARLGPVSGLPAGVHELFLVEDVFEYYDWLVARAKDYDAFVLTPSGQGSIAGLAPVKPWNENNFNHDLRPGNEVNIKFMVSPRPIDAIKSLNPKACLIGYKIAGETGEAALTATARHILKNSDADVIFAGESDDSKHNRIAVMSDGNSIKLDFNSHHELMAARIRSCGSAPEITKMLTLSTGHISKQTADKIDREPDSNELCVSVYSKASGQEQFGWFIYLPRSIPAGWPNDLKLCAMKAQALNCNVICFDSDGPEDPDLQLFDW